MNFSWIIDNELMISSAPESNYMIRMLKEAGIKAVVCATKNPFPDEAYWQVGMEILNLPLEPGNPPTLEQLKYFISWMTFMTGNKQPVLIFCDLGFERSALLAACHLIVNKHYSSRDALHEIREIRGDNAISAAKLQEFLIDCEFVKPLLADPLDRAMFDSVLITSILRRRCPWDREQTPETMLPNLLEEVYETWEAVLRNDSQAIASELGDVLLQVLMISRMRSETERFDILNVVSAMIAKLVKRHPHVFASSDTDTPEAVLKQWRSLKDTENGKISDIPSDMPVLGRAERIMSFAKKLGFDWTKIDGVIEKTHEELAELKTSVSSERHERTVEEFGDVFFSMLNLARFLKVNPELALKKTLDKFVERFAKIENKALELGKPISMMSIEEMDAIWNEAKNGD
jgi:MazG family protein